MPIVVDISFYPYAVINKPYRQLTGRTPHVKHLRIYTVRCVVGIPYRCKMCAVIVSAVRIDLKLKFAADFFKQAVVFCGTLPVEIEFGEKDIDLLSVGAIAYIAVNIRGNGYVYLSSNI